MTTRTSDFDFDLPPDLIAQHPASPRDSARLLVVGDRCADCYVRDLPDLLRPGDLLVANDTRVIPAQLQARRGNAHIGITLDRPVGQGAWHALARNARRLRAGDVISFAGSDDFTATIDAVQDGGSVILRFSHAGADFSARLAQAGALALPPYIDRPHGPTARDALDYQTIFAAAAGAVAAPTAGLHFTPALLGALADRGIKRAHVTLHVGAGTFLPVRVADIDDHRMHPERGELTEATAQTINAARRDGGRVICIGTTSLRLLESATDAAGTTHPFAGETDIFIRPGAHIRGADLLLTNFHLPRSTLFMLVCAFAGTARMKAAYAHAISHRYRFYSYGDATLLSRQ